MSNLAGVFADGLAYQRANQLLVLLIRRVKLLPIQYNLRMVLPASERTSFFGAYLRISEPRVRGMAAESARELTNSVREPRVRGMVAELSLSLSPGDERAKSTVHATWLCAHKKVHNSTKTWNKGSPSCASHAAEGRKSSWCMRCRFRCSQNQLGLV